MARKFDDSERERCALALPGCHHERLSVRQTAKRLGVSRSYIHRLSVELGLSQGAMKNVSERRKAQGWEPLAAGNYISCGAIQMKSFVSTRRDRSLSSFFIRTELQS